MSLKYYALPVAAAAMALAACNNSTAVTADPAPPPEERPAPPERPERGDGDARAGNPALVLNAALRASSASPRFEGGGITQSTNLDETGATADRVGAAFAGGDLSLTIERAAGRDALTLTAADRIPFDPGVPVEDEQPAPADLAAGFTAQNMAFSRVLSDSRLLNAQVSAGWTRDDRGDWVAIGAWIYMTGDLADDHVGWVETGVFADGPELRGPPDPMPTAGTAIYRGLAAGSFFTRYGTDFSDPAASFYRAPGTVEFGAFEGAVELQAEFGGETPTISGCVGCDVLPVNIHSVTRVDGETGERLYGPFARSSVELELGAAAIRPDGTFQSNSVTLRNPRFEAAVGDTPGLSSENAWGGRFSNILDDDGEPRLAAGTLGGHTRSIGGSESSFMGGFMAPKR